MIEMMGGMDHESERELHEGKYFSQEEQILQEHVCKFLNPMAKLSRAFKYSKHPESMLISRTTPISGMIILRNHMMVNVYSKDNAMEIRHIEAV